MEKEKVAEILEKIRNSGFDFVIIGDTTVLLEMKRKEIEGDIDIFLINKSSIEEEEKIMEIAKENGWELGQTWLGTPRIIAKSNDDEIQIDFYENLMDFFVPEGIINSTREVEIGERKFKVISLEDYIVLKAFANREEDEEELRTIVKLIAEGKLRIDRNVILEHLNFFEDPKSLSKRLREVGIILKT